MPPTTTEASRYQQLRGHLAYLKLGTAAEALPGVLDIAKTENLTPTATLERLLRIEVEATEARRLERRIRFSNLPTAATIEDFDFDAQRCRPRPDPRPRLEPTSDDDRHRLPVAVIVVTVTLGLLAAGCSGTSASPPETVQTPATTSNAETAEPNSTAVTGGSENFTLVQEVDGRRLFLQCRGSGMPKVILQSGLGNAGDIWSLTDTSAPAVFPALAETNRVCTYDRPGSMIITTSNAGGTVALADSVQRGRSDPAPMLRDPAEVVTELHDLLAAPDMQGPFVLVGHSLGGALDVLYARTYPDEVRGLVLVDSPLPPYRDLVVAHTWRKSVQVIRMDPSLAPGYQLESYDLGKLFDEIDAAGALPDIPVVVVRRGAPLIAGEPIPEGMPITQAELEALSAC